MLVPNFERNGGLIRAIVQDEKTKDILMDAYMNKEAWQETVGTGLAVYYSRTNQKLWRKGEVSGNVQYVREIRINCNDDSVLLIVRQWRDAACHDGYRTCFYRRVASAFVAQHGSFMSLHSTFAILEPRIFDPSQVYEKQGG